MNKYKTNTAVLTEDKTKWPILLSLEYPIICGCSYEELVFSAVLGILVSTGFLYFLFVCLFVFFLVKIQQVQHHPLNRPFVHYPMIYIDWGGYIGFMRK